MKETLPKSIQELILSLREKLKDEPEIVDMFERCYSNTLDTTVRKWRTAAPTSSPEISRPCGCVIGSTAAPVPCSGAERPGAG